MARLRIVIEGEMSPEEMKRYIAAAWGHKLPHDVKIATTDMDAADHAAVKEVLDARPDLPDMTPQMPDPLPEVVLEYADTPEPQAVATPANQLSEAQVLELASAGKLSSIVQAIQELGVTDTEAITAEVLRIKSAIPGLAKLSEQALVDRIPRVLEMMQ